MAGVSVKAGSAGVSAEASVTPTPSADGFHGCQGGGGRTQPMGFRFMELLGSHNISDMHIHGMDIEHTDSPRNRDGQSKKTVGRIEKGRIMD